jgi:hypothetical protein
MNAKIIFNWVKWGLAVLVVVILSLKSIHSTGTTEVGVRTIKWSLFSKSGVENKVSRGLPTSSCLFSTSGDLRRPAADRRNDHRDGQRRDAQRR